MNKRVNTKQFSGQIIIPPSKSISQRVMAAALLHSGKTVVQNFGISNDELAALKIIEKLGAEINFEEEKIVIISEGKIKATSEIDCGESGLATRLFTPIAALDSKPITITGSGSLLFRSMSFLQKPLQDLGVQLPSFSGQIPFTICGPIKAKNIKVDASESSQFLSGLLMALTAAADKKMEIEVSNLVSKPYIDLTIETLSLFGKNITHKNYQQFTIDPALFTSPKVVNIEIESDWSSAAFWIVAACIKGNLLLKGLNENSLQADRKILEIVTQVGAIIAWKNGVLQVASQKLSAFKTDLNDAPDLFPVLAILAACSKGTSSINGLKRLINKESNRAESITALLSQLGVQFEIEEDTIHIEGQSSFPSIKYNCPNDHRMAMAAAVISLRSKGKIEIENAECVAKSYPAFWEELSKFQ